MLNFSSKDKPDEVVPAEDVEPERLQSGLARSRGRLGEQLRGLLSGGEIDHAVLDELEALLISADVGVATTLEILDALRERLRRRELADAAAVRAALETLLTEQLRPVQEKLVVKTRAKPYVILVVGINGAGKTTTIGKLAKRCTRAGLSVMLAAGDTFRAAAVEQLKTWGERNDVPVVAQHTGADSASVIFDALESAKAREVDVLIADTAGRLHTQDNLMEELRKVKRVMAKIDPRAPHETLMVLDGGVGQNALNQVRTFDEAIGVDSLVVTKLDGTAKGGVVFALAREYRKPIRFVGVGEGIEDLQPFEAEAFARAVL